MKNYCNKCIYKEKDVFEEPCLTCIASHFMQFDKQKPEKPIRFMQKEAQK